MFRVVRVRRLCIPTTRKTENRGETERVKEVPGPEGRESGSEISIHIPPLSSSRSVDSVQELREQDTRRVGSRVSAYGLPVGAARQFLANRFECKQ